MKKILFAAASIALVSLAACSNKTSENSTDAADSLNAVADSVVEGVVEVNQTTDTIPTSDSTAVVETVTTVEGATVAQ